MACMYLGAWGMRGINPLLRIQREKVCAERCAGTVSTLALQDHPIAGVAMFCQQGATCFLLIPYPCHRAQPMSRAVNWRTNWCAAICRIMGIGQNHWLLICGDRPQCAQRVRNLPWRLLCWACAPFGPRGPSGSRERKSFHWQKWIDPELTQHCVFRDCSVMCFLR